jgi:peptide/nickel transport system permease protein
LFAFVLSRLLQAIPVMLVVALISFAMVAYVGDPVAIMLGQDFTEAQRDALVRDLGLDQPFFVQFARFIGNAVQGEFGLSYRLSRPVSELIAERAPATLELAFCAAALALLVGVPMGVFTGLYRRSWLSRFFLTFSLIGVSLPTFLIGILLILTFSVWLGWLPSFGRGEVVQLGWWSTGFLTWGGIKALILPSITVARARGLSDRAVNFGHALKNTLVPVITIAGLQFGSIIAFAIVTETVFQWPGMGLLFIQSVGAADIPVRAAYLMLIALVFVAINLLVDLLYFAVDPRLRADRGAAAGRA